MRSQLIDSKDNEIIMHAVPGALDMPDEYVRVPNEDSRRVEDRFSQGGLNGKRSIFQLFNGHYLEVSGKGQATRVVNLAYLCLEPARVRDSAWQMAIATLVLMTGAAVTLVSGRYPESFILGFSAVVALIAYISALKTRLIFRTRFGCIAVFELPVYLFWRRRKASGFASVIQERIDGAARILPDGECRLAAEIAEHRRMLMEGWLSKTRYDLAKKRIFARYRRSV